MAFLTILTAVALATSDPGATAIVNKAIDRMGGEATLRSVTRVHYRLMTEWSRLNFDARPFHDYPSFEEDEDSRDYSIPAWRNSRNSFGTAFQYLDIVRDSVGGRLIRGKWTALNTAYIDEREEVFTYTPDRLMLYAHDATDLKVGADTVIGGVPHARVAGTINGRPSTIFFDKVHGLPAMFRFRSGALNDFGLVPLGVMDVEVWYSRWATLQNRMSVPWQWDVKRAGRLYKRLSIVQQTINPEFAADSFAVSDSVRNLFLTTQRKPMHDLPIDTAKIVEDRFAVFNTFGTPAGAIKVGSQWLLLEGGQAPLSVQRSVEWLEKTTGAKVGGAVLTAVSSPGNGGLAWLMEKRVPTWIAPGSVPFAAATLSGYQRPNAGYTAVMQGRWVKLAGDSVRIEPFDFPNAPRTALVYVPSLKYLYSAALGSPLDLAIAMEFAKAKGWTVERFGNQGTLQRPVPQTR